MTLQTPTDALVARAQIITVLGTLPSSALLTSAEAAAYLGTSRATLADWRCDRKGPRYHGRGAFIRYRLADLDDFLADRAGEIAPRSGEFAPVQGGLAEAKDTSRGNEAISTELGLP
jgi:hypothetical protein